MFSVYLCYAILSVPCSLVNTCWKRVDLLCVVFSCVLSLLHMVFWVRYGTSLYGFLIFACLLYMNSDAFCQILAYLYSLILKCIKGRGRYFCNLWTTLVNQMSRSRRLLALSSPKANNLRHLDMNYNALFIWLNPTSLKLIKMFCDHFNEILKATISYLYLILFSLNSFMIQ